jgi:hypothetical protein
MKTQPPAMEAGNSSRSKGSFLLLMVGVRVHVMGKEMIQPNIVAWPINDQPSIPDRSCDVRLEPFFATDIQHSHPC